MSDIKWYDSKETVAQPAFTTPYTIVHFITGMLAYTMSYFLFPAMPLLYSFLIWVVLHGAYEIHDLQMTNNDNSLANSIGDTIFSIMGFFSAMYIYSSRRVTFDDVAITAFILLIAISIIKEPPH
jgi:hypothetical protein